MRDEGSGAPDALHEAATRLGGAAQAVGRTGASVRAEAARALGGDAWLGTAARAAHRAHHRQATAAEQVAAALQRAAAALARLGGAVAGARRARSAAEAEAAEPWHQFYRPSSSLGADDLVLVQQLARVDAAEQAALAAAAAALRSVAADLRRLRLHPGRSPLAASVDPAQAVTLGRLGLLTGPSLTPGEVAAELRRLVRLGDPVAIQAFTLSLSSAARQALVRGLPGLVGATDGVPPAMRYAANRRLLTRALDAARQAGDAAVAKRIAGWLTAGRQFLLVDLARGRVAEVFGNLATAGHVAVVVPGICNDLSTFDALAADAANLQAQADRLTPGDAATIAWLGYRTPGLLDAPFDDSAVAATHRLADLVAGLVLRSGVTTTLVAHSYGSMLAGRALRDGLVVDAVVALGSPGMTTSTAAGLHAAPGTRIYAGRAPGDYVSLSENFGRDPSDPRFGATRIATHSPGEDGPIGHTGYFAGDSECTRNLARIVTGRYDRVTVIAPSPVEQGVGAFDTLTSVARISMAMALADAEALAHLLPGPARTPAETAVEAARRVEHLNERLADPDLIVDALDPR